MLIHKKENMHDRALGNNEKQEIERLLSYKRFLPRFPPRSERLFQIAYAHRTRPRMRVTLCILFAMYMVYATYGYIAYGATVGWMGFLVMAVLAGMAIPVSWMVRRDVFLQLTYGMAVLACGTGFIWLATHAPSLSAIISCQIGLAVLIFWIYIPSGMRIGYAFMCATIITDLAIFSLAVTPALLDHTADILLAQLIVIHLLAAYASYRMERETRRGYLHGRMVRLVHQEMIELVGVDDLTGLANHRRMDDFFAHTWARAQRDHVEIALIAVDVDCLTLLNRQFGRDIGDICLKKIGAVIGHHRRRPGDMAARYRGGMFLLLLYACNERNAMTVAEHIRCDVADLSMLHPSSTVSWTVTVSAGVHACIPVKTTSKELALASAQTNIQIAKRSGRNQTVATREALPRDQKNLARAPRLAVEKTEIMRGHN